MKPAAHTKCVSLLVAWALAFGCTLGWDVFVLPVTMFLPMSGWLGTSIGIVIAALVMGVIAWNYHYMINWRPGPGGIYTYISQAFGCDHGFMCAWFICLAYGAIAWSDVMAMGMLAHYMFGSSFHSPVNYIVAGHVVCMNCIILAIVVSALVVVVCCRRKFSGRLQTLLAIILALGIVICAVAGFARHTGGVEAFGPAFAPFGGSRLMQILGIVAMSPWLFIGFEVISNVSGEFRFSPRKSFGVMAGAIAAAAAGYILILLVLASKMDLSGMAFTDGPDGAVTLTYHAIDILRGMVGRFGSVVLGISLVGAILTNLIGDTIAAACLLSAMAEDGALPAWFGRKNGDGAPQNALIAVSAIILFIAPLGASVIDFVLDIALVCAVVAYGYISAATYRVARSEGNRKTALSGLAGLVLSIAIALLFMMPGTTSGMAAIATESYLTMVVWCLLGLAMYLVVFRRDKLLRFGRSTVAWISLLAIILIMSVLWIRQSTYDITDKAYGQVLYSHAEICHQDSEAAERMECTRELRKVLEKEHDYVTRSIMRNNIVQTSITIFAIALMVVIYNILRRREGDLEREKTKAKGYFFSTVSHDIRTPLNAIIGFTEMLRIGMKTEEERKQALDAISESGKTLLGLINDVLDLSKLEAGKMSIAPEPTDCEPLFRSIMDGFKISSAKPGLEFRCRVKPMPALMLDPLRIRQIVFNLVGNAAKFTERGYIMLRAAYEILPGDEAGIFRFEVEDTGSGISEEDLKRLGRAYVQVGAKKSRNGGTGLGLAICRQLTKAMGGQLLVSSTLGKGSTFTVEIPGVHSVSGAVSPQVEPVKRMDTEIKKRIGIRRILVVDDQKMNCMVMKAILRHVGDFEIVTAMDGKEALDILEAPGAEKFDLVLTDLWMPNLDGEGLLRKIRANPALSSQRVIAVTADVEFDGKAEGAEFDGVLYKPVTTAKLSKIIYNMGGGG